MSLFLKPAQPADAPELARLCRDEVEQGLGWKWRPSAIAKLIAHPDIEVVVARQDGYLLGFAGLEFGSTEAELLLLAVAPPVRRQGVGSTLLHYLFESTAVAGIDAIRLHVRAENEPAVRFYESVGFTIEAFRRRHYAGREDALRMVRQTVNLLDSESLVPIDLSELLRGAH